MVGGGAVFVSNWSLRFSSKEIIAKENCSSKPLLFTKRLNMSDAILAGSDVCVPPRCPGKLV